MSSKIELPETGWISLFEAMIWLAEMNGEPYHTDTTDALSGLQVVENAWALVGPKETFLAHARNGSARSRGRLRYVAWPNPEGYDHGWYTLIDHEQIDPVHWPDTTPNRSLDWELSQLKTGKGVYVDIEIDVTELRTRWVIPLSTPEQTEGPTESIEVPADWYDQVCAWLAGPYYKKHKNDRPNPTRDTALIAARENFKDWPITRGLWRNDIWPNNAPAAWKKVGPKTKT